MAIKKYNIEVKDDTIFFINPTGDELLTIDFRRTLRVPDNDDLNNLPPGLGKFPLFKVKDYQDKLPSKIAAKGGLFMPMYQREAMWVKFKSTTPFAIKVYAGGVNAISGESDQENMATRLRRETLIEKGESIQDYVVTPDQLWLDGFATEPGVVRQFVAMPVGEGYSVEAQLTGQEKVNGLQFEITPMSSLAAKRTLRLFVRTLTGKTISLEVKHCAKVFDIMKAIQDKEGIPPDQQRLILCKENPEKLSAPSVQLNENALITRYRLKDNAHLHLVLKLRGGGVPTKAMKAELAKKEAEMSLAAGGQIEQVIKTDPYSSTIWDEGMTMAFNLQLVNSASFLAITGQKPPTTPISPSAYKAYGLPFFKMYEEPSDVTGDFSGVKSISQLDQSPDPSIQFHTVDIGDGYGKKNRAWVERADLNVNDPDDILCPTGARRGFRTVEQLKAEMRRMDL